ncbi:hypothetical protein VNO80_15347 [Phaseolus coccineus]|uniref:Uncharacterized protein n=1 Tax=Phaseolus coccineus TaxID=3886 RepID=A0AAN9MLH8_PHACN
MKERNCYRRWGRRSVPPEALPFFFSSASEQCVFSPPSLVSVLNHRSPCSTFTLQLFPPFLCPFSGSGVRKRRGLRQLHSEPDQS